MKYDQAIQRLKEFPIPSGWAGSLFLLPESAIADIYTCAISERRIACLELGTGFGATSCILAAAMEETGGHVTTVDMVLHRPIGADLVAQQLGLSARLDVVVEPLGYNWWLADRIRERLGPKGCEPIFDFCLLDGAHEFQPDALAFTLASKLLKRDAILILDDMNLRLRDIPNWKDSHGSKSDRELDTCQIGMLYDLLVCQDRTFRDFRVTHDGRIGWARKKNRPWFRRLTGPAWRQAGGVR